ncbi:S-layer homology domain-containing protein [Niallia oryzisoli]|uniref:S-layer homology domain-containing protein n=1 Tax=Niallia oryzisoli TaxID=1737571 RepID=UPI003736ECAF
MLKKKLSFISGLAAFTLLFTPIASNALAAENTEDKAEVVILEESGQPEQKVTQTVYDGVTYDAYGVADDAYGVTDDTYSVADDAYGVTDDTYGVVDDAYGVTDDTYGVTDDAYGVTDDTYGVKTFNDIQGHWAQGDIEVLATNDIIKGKTADSFAPDADITRAEFITLVVRMLKSYNVPEGSVQLSFNDVDANAWYAQDVQYAASLGLTNGDGNGRFNPNTEITREQIATFIGRALTIVSGQQIPVSSDQVLVNYTDRNAISSYAKDSVALLVQFGIINGKTADTIAPLANATRAETAAIINRGLSLINLYYN